MQLLLLYRRIRYGCAYRRIHLTQGKFAIVDPKDYARLSKYKWRICNARNTMYAERSIRKGPARYGRVLMHRMIIHPAKGFVIDHINGNGLDNRSANLRLATVSQNAANAPKKSTNTSGFKGVWFDKQKKKFRACIWHQKKRHHLGYFKTKIEAAKAYDQAAIKYHKQFARPNFK
jgi:hypothetical protein